MRLHCNQMVCYLFEAVEYKLNCPFPEKRSMNKCQKWTPCARILFQFFVYYKNALYEQIGQMNLRPYVRRKSDLPLYIGQIHDIYFDTTPVTLNDNANAKSV